MKDHANKTTMEQSVPNTANENDSITYIVKVVPAVVVSLWSSQKATRDEEEDDSKQSVQKLAST